MRLWDGTEIVKPVVDHGLTQWDTMAGELDRTMSKLAAELKDALAAAPWGQGVEGRAFCAAHFRDDGPNRLITQCTRLTKEITAESGLVRQAVDNTLKMDADIRRDIAANLMTWA